MAPIPLFEMLLTDCSDRGFQILEPLVVVEVALIMMVKNYPAADGVARKIPNVKSASGRSAGEG
jgi:hypothetical protein